MTNDPKKRLAHLADTSPKELWNVVHANSNSIPTQANANMSNSDIVNNYFAGIATDDCYIKSEVFKFYRPHVTEYSRVLSLPDYAVETYLRKIRNTSDRRQDMADFPSKD